MPSVQPVGLLPFADFRSFHKHRTSRDSLFEQTFPVDRAHVNPEHDYPVRQYCAVCHALTDMQVNKDLAFDEAGLRMPLWRETITCPGCSLNNRMRGLLHIMSADLRIPRDADLYFTEQITPTFKAAKKGWPQSVGSEYLRDGTRHGRKNRDGVRCEDMTALSFASGSFDGVITLDVIEHVPDYVAALREAFRVLRPGGRLVLSAPIDLERRTSAVRARVGPEGEIEHILEPEYHGDPLDADGLLCFTTFGWDFLQTCRDVGFEDAELNFYWSARYGYFGVQYVVLATRPAGAAAPPRRGLFGRRR